MVEGGGVGGVGGGTSEPTPACARDDGGWGRVFVVTIRDHSHAICVWFTTIRDSTNVTIYEMMRTLKQGVEPMLIDTTKLGSDTIAAIRNAIIADRRELTGESLTHDDYMALLNDLQGMIDGLADELAQF